jgi:hypothetical protein
VRVFGPAPMPGGPIRFRKPRAHSELAIDSAEQTGQHQLVNCESDQAREKQNQTGHGHREETVRREFFAHGAPPIASLFKQNGRKLIAKRGRTRAALSSLMHSRSLSDAMQGLRPWLASWPYRQLGPTVIIPLAVGLLRFGTGDKQWARLRCRAHTAGAEIKPAAVTRRVFSLALAGAAGCCLIRSWIPEREFRLRRRPLEPTSQTWRPTAVQTFFESPRGRYS